MTCPKCGRETTASHLKWAEGPGDKRHEVREKLDNEAAIAATKADRQWNATLGPQTRSNYRSGFRDGYRDAATLREKEIAYLSDARSRELQVLVKYLRQIKERDAEIATLRARVAELEMVIANYLPVCIGDCGCEGALAGCSILGDDPESSSVAEEIASRFAAEGRK